MTGELGQRLSRHGGSLLAGGWGWYVGAILLLSSVAWLVGFVKALLTGDGSPIEQLAMMLGAMLVGILLLISPVLRLVQSVEVFEHGLVHRRPWGSTVVRRDQVAGAQHTRHHSRAGAYDEIDIHLRDGGTARIVGIKDAAQIVAFLRSWASGGAPPASGGGWTPPGGGGGWTPPGGGGGWTPPGGGGGWTPPSS